MKKTKEILNNIKITRKVISQVQDIMSPQVQIDPALGKEVQDAVNELKKMDPNFFKGVSKIQAFTGSPFGQVEAGPQKDPTVVRLNINKIKQEVQRQFGQLDINNPKHKQALEEGIKRAIIEVVSHERFHTLDYNPSIHSFPGGEGVAERGSQEVMRKMKYDQPIEIQSSLNKISILKQRTNPKNNKKQWCLVSKKDPNKILEWYGSEKPSKKQIEDTEKRVEYFKHKNSSSIFKLISEYEKQRKYASKSNKDMSDYRKIISLKNTILYKIPQLESLSDIAILALSEDKLIRNKAQDSLKQLNMKKAEVGIEQSIPGGRGVPTRQYNTTGNEVPHPMMTRNQQELEILKENLDKIFEEE